MFACLISLVTVLTTTESVTEHKGEEIYENAKQDDSPHLPLPVSSRSGEDGRGSFMLLGRFAAGSGNLSIGSGWRFEDGTTTEGLQDTGSGQTEVMCKCTLWDNENCRYSFFVGSRTGLRSEHYLGHRFATIVDLGGTFLPGRAPSLGSVNLLWYPREGLTVSLGYNFLGGGLDCEWCLSF
jgi:hypothetical protein